METLLPSFALIRAAYGLFNNLAYNVIQSKIRPCLFLMKKRTC